MEIDRRQFLKLTSITTGGLLISGVCYSADKESTQKTAGAQFPMLRIHEDNTLTIFNTRSEMGQGVGTLLAQYLIEELDSDWALIRDMEQAGASQEIYGPQNTIGAISSFLGWHFHRKAGAQIRKLLVEAAAEVWQCSEDKCKTNKGVVSNTINNQKLTYGQLASLIANKSLPEKVELKTPEKFSVIGQNKPRLDLPQKINGKAMFGIDVELENMAICSLQRCPVFGGKVKSYDASDALKQTGVISVIQISSGIGVIANNYWNALQGRKKLRIEWEFGQFESVSSQVLIDKFKKQLDSPEKELKHKGNVNSIFSSGKVTTMDFEFPLIAHGTMEPMNCTARVTANECEVWAPTQNRNNARQAVATLLERPIDQVTLNTTLMGGGFGRRAQEDFVLEAVEVARQVDYPVKLIWSREDDTQHDYYRPLNVQRMQASLGSDNKLSALRHVTSTLSTSPYHFDLNERGKEEGDWVAYGGSEDTLYQVEHFQSQVTLNNTPLTTGILRGISHGYINFANEVMMEKMSELAQVHPLTFRLNHLEQPRAVAVLKLLRAKTKRLEQDKENYIGYAFAYEKAPKGNYQYYNAAAAIFTREAGQLKLSKVVLALDHGQMVNPDGIRSQVMGSATYAVSMMFNDQITLDNGRVKQSNFHDYKVARITDAPEVEVHLVENHEWPMGVGEKLQGTIQPAIANALYSATGNWIKAIPIDLDNLHHLKSKRPAPWRNA